MEPELIGRSAAMQRVRATVERVAATDSTLMLCGESGVGKEVAARAIHRASARAAAPFVAVNCAAIPHSLVEAELFGHEKGSFTGATRTREGVFERAGRGTLLLDEISEMPLEAQSRLLRVLETRTVQRVGGEADIAIRCRVIAATNRDPQDSIRAGRLRADIYYRLAVVMVQLPPLRERIEDVALLAQHFLDELNRRYATRKPLDAEWVARLQRHSWPGNVRELRNLIERAFVFSDGAVRLADAELPTPQVEVSPRPPVLPDATIRVPIGATLEDLEKTLIVATLRHFAGNKRRTAEALGCSLKTLYNKLQTYQRPQHLATAGVAAGAAISHELN